MCFHPSVVQATKKLGVSQITLKKACRNIGSPGWPGGKLGPLEAFFYLNFYRTMCPRIEIYEMNVRLISSLQIILEHCSACFHLQLIKLNYGEWFRNSISKYIMWLEPNVVWINCRCRSGAWRAQSTGQDTQSLLDIRMHQLMRQQTMKLLSTALLPLLGNHAPRKQ